MHWNVTPSHRYEIVTLFISPQVPCILAMGMVRLAQSRVGQWAGSSRIFSTHKEEAIIRPDTGDICVQTVAWLSKAVQGRVPQGGPQSA